MSKVIEKTTCHPTVAFTLFVAIAMVTPSPVILDLSAADINGSIRQFNSRVDSLDQTPDEPLSEGKQKNVATNGKPNTSQQAYLTLPSVLMPDNTDKRFKKQTVSYGIITIPSVHQKNWPSDVLASTSLVSSSLGRRITLVGTKPSGTS